MNNDKSSSKGSSLKRGILELLGIAAVLGLLYFTGLHTPIQGALQRAVLWTGLYNADFSNNAITDGPFLTDADYSFRMISPVGERLTLRDLKGSVLFVNVWASWCPPCIAEMPAIAKLYSDLKHRDDIRFLLISKDQDQSKAVAFMQNRAFSMPYYFPAGRFPQQFQSSYIPSTFVISKEGRIIYKKEGIANYNSADFKKWLIKMTR